MCCVCVFIYMCVSLGKGVGVVSVSLQEEAAVALCGFFSVPLTCEDRTTRTRGEIKTKWLKLEESSTGSADCLCGMRLKLAAAAAATTTSPLQDVCEGSNKMSWVMPINQLIFWSIWFSFTPTNQSNKFEITCTFKLHYATQCPHVSFKWCRLTEIQT